MSKEEGGGDRTGGGAQQDNPQAQYVGPYRLEKTLGKGQTGWWGWQYWRVETSSLHNYQPGKAAPPDQEREGGSRLQASVQCSVCWLSEYWSAQCEMSAGQASHLLHYNYCLTNYWLYSDSSHQASPSADSPRTENWFLTSLIFSPEGQLVSASLARCHDHHRSPVSSLITNNKDWGLSKLSGQVLGQFYSHPVSLSEVMWQ